MKSGNIVPFGIPEENGDKEAASKKSNAPGPQTLRWTTHASPFLSLGTSTTPTQLCAHRADLPGFYREKRSPQESQETTPERYSSFFLKDPSSWLENIKSLIS